MRYASAASSTTSSRSWSRSATRPRCRWRSEPYPAHAFSEYNGHRERHAAIHQPLGLLAQARGRRPFAGIRLTELTLDLGQQIGACEPHVLLARCNVEIGREEIEVGRGSTPHRVRECQRVGWSERVDVDEVGVGEQTPAGRESDLPCDREVERQTWALTSPTGSVPASSPAKIRWRSTATRRARRSQLSGGSYEASAPARKSGSAR